MAGGHILIADKFDQSGIAALEQLGETVVVEPDLGPDSLVGSIAGVEILVVRSTKVPAEVLAAADQLKAVIRAGAGFDTIDFVAAGRHGISVCNCPGMNAAAVAELTMGHLISLDRRIPAQTDELRSGHWNKKEYSKARGLKGRSLLVIGTGAIGTEVIQRAKAFGMTVYAQSRSLRPETARALGIEPIAYTREALYEALGKMDAVSVHVAATPDTKGLCDSRFFESMSPGAYFVNTSRGELVDEQALIESVKDRGIRAAVDVYQNQPGFKDGDWTTPLADVEGIQLTHHCGASTDQAQSAVADEVVRIVAEYREGNGFVNVVNESSLASASA